MNDELKKRLLDYLELIEKGANKAGEFVVEQAPLYVQEFLAWEFWSYVVLCIVCIIGQLVFVGLGFYFNYVIGKMQKCDLKELVIAGKVISFGLALILFLPILINAYKSTKVLIAPRVVIVEELRRNLK